ncbi:hypothetical protein FKM82_031009 [Ascaphus truei]
MKLMLRCRSETAYTRTTEPLRLQNRRNIVWTKQHQRSVDLVRLLHQYQCCLVASRHLAVASGRNHVASSVGPPYKVI